MSESQTIHLAADLSFLHTDYLWRTPGSWVGYDYYSTSEFYEDIARTHRVLRFDRVGCGLSSRELDPRPTIESESRQLDAVIGGTDSRFNGNTYPVVYDALGRFIFLGVTADF